MKRVASPLAGFVFFGLALWALYRALSGHQYVELAAALQDLPRTRLWLCAMISGCGYLVLGGYDLLAFRFIGRRIPLRSVVAASLISNALGNNLGNILITGSAVRYWLYTALGLSAAQITRIVLFCSVGFWLGYLFLGAFLFLVWPVHLPPALQALGTTSSPIGVICAAIVAGYVGLAGMRRTWKLGNWRIELPSPGLTVGQILVASTDLCLMAAALYALLPPFPGLTFASFLSVFLIALIAGTLSQVPGGLGVFESAMVLLLAPRADVKVLLAALLAFRGIYYLLPLFLALAFVALRESIARHFRARGRRAGLSGFAPQILAAAIFLSGAVLLFSGAVPAESGRLAIVHRLVTLPLIEASHFGASLVGAALLLLARGLQRRLDAAWFLAAVLLAVGSVLSLIKGWDFEEAFILGVAFLALLPFRRQFYRKSSLIGEPFSALWVASIAMVLAGSAWLALFAQTHAAVADQPWWQMALEAEGPRSLRASVGAVGLAVLFALHRLIRPMRVKHPLPSPTDIERARPIVERSLCTHGNLVFRGDKRVLFSRAGDAFLMYARHGRSWIAMGDPVGSESGGRELLWQFRDLVDRFDGWCVFFEVRPERRQLYADLGLTLTPLGEEARVDLGAFTLAAPHYKRLRQARSKLTRSGYDFRIVEKREVACVVPALRRISEAWVAGKAGREKNFSTASFDPDYLMNFPVAVVQRGAHIVAFANIWESARQEEVSIDLMRHLPDAPNGTMDFLFTELLLWGKRQSFHWFNFGMTPLCGLHTQSDAPVWSRVGNFLYRYGEHFYHFDGLRHYKAKFHPTWTTLYLASPGGLALGPILVDVTALIAGGVSGLLSKRRLGGR